jgi:hypothetical protein
MSEPSPEARALVLRIRATTPNSQGGVVPRQSASEMAREVDRFAAAAVQREREHWRRVCVRVKSDPRKRGARNACDQIFGEGSVR